MEFQVPIKRLVKRAAGVPTVAVKQRGEHRRSSPPPVTVALKIGWRLLQKPEFIRCFVEFQAEKELFNVLYRNQRAGYANKMRQLSFRITDVCNLRCHTCCQWGDNGYLLDRKLADLYKQEVPTARYIEMLREVKAAGHTPLLYFWGGEPTMYKGLCDVIEEGARLGMAPTLVTNGLNIPKMASRMVGAPLAFIQLSLDGPTKEIHNGARPGTAREHDNFQDVVDSIDSLYEEREKQGKKLPIIGTYTTVSAFNQHRLIDIYERFKSKVDLFIFTLAWWIDEKSADAHDEEFNKRFGFKPSLHRGFMGDWHDLDVKALSEQLKELDRRSKLPGGKAVYIQPNITEPEALKSFFSDHDETFGFDQCISIFQNPELDSNGNLSPCRDYHDYVVGNIKEQSLVELWNSPKYVEFRQSIRKDGLMPVCARCCGLMGY
jgi:radical SAM protein with 4Fe4S-binding SPASM domain